MQAPFSSKIRVGVLRGGPSNEYEVSLKTGATVLKHLPSPYHSVDIFIDRSGVWHMQGVSIDPHRALARVDVVFNALHGEYGEDGGVQHLLETYHFPFSGPGRFACVLAMNKLFAKAVAARLGIKTPLCRLVRRDEVSSLSSFAAYLHRAFPQPSVIKPVNKGSSVGVTVARTPPEIADALDTAFLYSDNALVEEYLPGKEASCGVFENYRGERFYTLLPVEAEPPAESRFFDYYAKYSGRTVLRCPPAFTAEEKSELQRTARAMHEALGLRHYSQSDFIIHPRRGIYFLETDALPNLVEESSPFLHSLQAVGATTPQVISHIVALSFVR